MYNIIYETSCQYRFDARLLNAWGWCTGMTQRDGTGREVERGSGWGTRIYLWQIHVDVRQNQYNILTHGASLVANMVKNPLAMQCSILGLEESLGQQGDQTSQS